MPSSDLTAHPHPKTDMKKYALVMSGGGARGLFAVEILRLMLQNSFDFKQIKIVSGVSVGAIIGAVFAQGDLQLLVNWFPILRNQDVYEGKLSLRRTLWQRIIGKNHILDLEPLHKLLIRYIDLSKINATGRTMLIGFTNLETGKYETLSNWDFDNNEDYIRCIMASSCMPGIWQPQSFKTKTGIAYNNCVDGGVVQVSPIGAVLPHQPDHVIIINSSPVDELIKTDFNDLEDVIFRSIDIQGSASFAKDMEYFLKINAFAPNKCYPNTIYQTEIHDSSLDFENPTYRLQRIKDAQRAYKKVNP